MEILDIHSDKKLVDDIRELLSSARARVEAQVNVELLATYFEIGKLIAEYEGTHQERYGKSALLNLSKRLTREFGKGFSRSNMYNMRAFYLYKKIFQSVTGKLSWTHYCELLSISDEQA